MRPFLVCLALCLALGGTTPARGDDEPAPAPVAESEVRGQVATWLKGLAVEDFEIREAAREGLQRLGLQARDLLEAAQDDPDPEVRRTVRAILAAAGGQPAPVRVARPGDFAALGLVSLAMQAAPLTDVFAALGKPMAATFEVPEPIATGTTHLALEEVPCFDALDLLLRAHDLVLTRPFDMRGVGAISARPADYVRPPRAGFGPTQLSVVEVSATRAFGSPAPPRYALKLRLDWAPAVQVSQYDMPNIEVARDPAGKAYKPTADMSRRVSYGVGSSSKSHELTVHLEPGDPQAAPRLAVLELSLPVTLRHDLAVVDVELGGGLPRTLGPGGAPVADGTDGSIRVESLEEVAGSPGEWVVEIIATLQDDFAQRTLETFVLDPDGSVSRLGVYGGRSRSADGTLRLTARAYRGTRGKPKALRAVWYRREEQGTLRFRLEDIVLR